MRRLVVVPLLAVLTIVASVLPAGAATDPVDSLAQSRIRVTTTLVGLSEDVDGGRVDLSANGQFVVFDRPGRGIGVFDSVRRQTIVLGDDDARPFAVSDSGEVVLYTSVGQPYRWNRSNGQSMQLPWSGGLITDMALSGTGDVLAYSEQTSGISGIFRTWEAPVDSESSARVVTFGATVTETPIASSRDVFVTATGRTALFRSGSGFRGIDIPSSTVSNIALTSLNGLDRAGVLQVEPGDAPGERFRIGQSTSTARDSVNYPDPSDTALDSVELAGDGSSVVFHSNDEFYRWTTDGRLVYLQPATGTTVLGDPRDSSITGRFVLSSRAGPQNGILEIVEIAGAEIPIVDVADLEGAQLGDQVRRLYLAYFDREPDAVGYQVWRVALAQGTPLETISEAFADSTEFQNTYGALDDPAFVDLVYNNVLGREPDAEGRAFWISQLAAGESRGKVMLGFSEATEFRNQTETSTPLNVPTAHQIERLYRAYFDRPADQGGLDFWLEQFVAGADLGTLSQEFVGSTEFQNTYGALDDEGFVELVYANVLDREPDDDGRAFWLAQLTTGTLTRGQVMVGFSESTEFIVATDTLP